MLHFEHSEYSIILSDLARTFLFPKDTSYSGTLNHLHERLLSINPSYNFFEFFRIDYDYLKILKEYAQNATLALFTSGLIQNKMELQHELSKYFEHIFDPQVIGLKKDKPEAYRTIADKLGARADQIVFIDDDSAFLVAAKLAGTKTIHYTCHQDLSSELKELIPQ